MAGPGLNEITVTTSRNRKMKSDDSAAIKGVQKSGTHVAEKDTSTKKKESKADGKVSAKPAPAAVGVTASLPIEKKGWEGSSDDWSSDYAASKRKGMTTEQYENSAADRVADAAGERRVKADEASKSEPTPDHKPGVSAFANKPKASHGYGHPASAHDGHLRNSGHAGGHRLGKKK